MNMNFKKLALPIGLALMVGIAFLVISTKSATKKDNPTTQAATTQASIDKTALTVNTVKPTLQNMTDTIVANGNIAAWQEAVVGSEVNGLLLSEVLVNVGDTVKRGQVIARFNTGTMQAEIAQAQANIADAQAAAIEASSNATRARSIQESGALSAQQIEQYLSAEASTKAKVASAKASLNMQQIKLKQTNVYAPDSGIISSRTATVGAVVAAGQELFKLIRQGRIEWRAELTSADVTKIKTGMHVAITLPDGSQTQGQVRAFAPSVDAQTRNAIVYVDLPNTTAKSGMYAKGMFALSETPAITLPTSAIVMREGFSYVMQVLPNRTIKQIKVNLGRSAGNTAEVLGLPEAEDAEFVASGAAFLSDGDKVKVVNQQSIPQAI